MKIDKIKYKNNEIILIMDSGDIKIPGENIIGMLKFYCKEKNIEINEMFEINYDDFIKEYHQIIQTKLQNGEAWTIVLKIPNNNPEIKFLRKTMPDIFFDKDLAQKRSHGYQMKNTIPGAFFSVEPVSIGYKFNDKEK